MVVVATLNPNAVALVALTTVVGALLGAVLVGLAVGLAVVIFATMYG